MTAPVRTPVEVAVGILIRDDGRLLLASRPAGKPYAGYWEFPGGKVEAGETVASALAREIHEELGVDLGAVLPWIVRVFDYPHARVRLHFCRVFQWSGALHAREGQQFGFFALDAMPQPLLPATVPILRGLQLPSVYALSAAARFGTGDFLRRLGVALAGGLKLVQLREPDLPPAAVERLFVEMNLMTRAAGACLLVSSRHSPSLWQQADGVHLTADDLRASNERPRAGWVAASVHAVDELQRAGELGADFAVLGSVQPTASHPLRPALGWPAFASIVQGTPIPVYALGGLRPQDVEQARAHGAQGVALLSEAWQENQWRGAGESLGGVSSASWGTSPGTT